MRTLLLITLLLQGISTNLSTKAGYYQSDVLALKTPAFALLQRAIEFPHLPRHKELDSLFAELNLLVSQIEKEAPQSQNRLHKMNRLAELEKTCQAAQERLNDQFLAYHTAISQHYAVYIELCVEQFQEAFGYDVLYKEAAIAWANEKKVPDLTKQIAAYMHEEECAPFQVAFRNKIAAEKKRFYR